MFSPTLNHSTDNNPTRAKQANCQLTCSYMRKIASKNLCAYPICHYEWQGPVELRQGRAELLASSRKVSFQHRREQHWFQSEAPRSFSTDSWTDPPTGCRVKETFELHRGAWCAGVKKVDCNPGEVISHKNWTTEGWESRKVEVRKISPLRHPMLWRWFLLCCICSTSQALKPTASTMVLI